jgi:hypothetical protein
MLLIVWMLSQVINIQLLKFDTNKAHKLNSQRGVFNFFRVSVPDLWQTSNKLL